MSAEPDQVEKSERGGYNEVITERRTSEVVVARIENADRRGDA